MLEELRSLQKERLFSIGEMMCVKIYYSNVSQCYQIEYKHLAFIFLFSEVRQFSGIITTKIQIKVRGEKHEELWKAILIQSSCLVYYEVQVKGLSIK